MCVTVSDPAERNIFSYSSAYSTSAHSLLHGVAHDLFSLPLFILFVCLVMLAILNIVLFLS